MVGIERVDDQVKLVSTPERQYDSYNWYTFAFWKKRVKELPYGCQVWP